MLLPRLSRVLVLPALLSGAPLAAQGAGPPSCAGAPADEAGMRIAFTLPGTPKRAAGLVTDALRGMGYSVSEPPRDAGGWTAAPSHAWVPDYLAQFAKGQASPGVQLSGDIQPMGDSAEVTIVARTLCSLAEAASDERLRGSVEDLLERFSALYLMHAVVEQARDGRLGSFSLDLPPRLGDHRLMRRIPSPPRSLVLPFTGADSLDVDVFFYRGPIPFARCTPSCAEVNVEREVSGYIRTFSQTRAQMGASAIEFRGMEPLTPGPGDGWIAGRHLVHDIVRPGETLSTHYYVYVFPDHFVKFRSTFPVSPARAERLKAFVAAALPAIIRTEGGPSPPALPASRP